LQFEKPRPLLGPCLLGKFGVRVWSNRFQYRGDGLFKGTAFGGGGHLAFQTNRFGESGERPPVPVARTHRRVNNLMGQHARDPHWIIENRGDHDLKMPIRAMRFRPAFPQPLSFGGEGTSAW
jgi:hypothetical protein